MNVIRIHGSQLTQEPSRAHAGSLKATMLEEMCGWRPIRWRPDLGWCLCITLHTIVLPKLEGFLLQYLSAEAN